MIKAISSVNNNSKNKNVSFSNASKSMDLPCAKKMKVLGKDEFKLKGIACGVDLSFEDM